MRTALSIFILFINTVLFGQEIKPDWYILEKGANVSVIKPGVNDLTFYLAASNNKPLDKQAVDAMINNISFHSGYVILVHDKINDSYIATDIEGRNLVVKGNITKVIRGTGSGIAYLKENIKTDWGVLKKTSYVWIKEHIPGDKNVMVQCANEKTISIPESKMYNINATMLEMAGGMKMKTVD